MKLIHLSALILALFVACNTETNQAPHVNNTSNTELADYTAKIKAERAQTDSIFADSTQSPLETDELKNFRALPYFPIDDTYRIKAKFVRTTGSLPFEMPTTTERLPLYELYGEAIFQLNGRELKLSIFQNHDLREHSEYKDYLFLPFADATNGEETYFGGRYLDLTIPLDDSITIDFNKAYNPYCAYNKKYSCPLVPKENILPVKIEAGVKDYKAKQ